MPDLEGKTSLVVLYNPCAYSAGQYFNILGISCYFIRQFIVSWISLDIEILYFNIYRMYHLYILYVKDEVYSLDMNSRVIL